MQRKKIKHSSSTSDFKFPTYTKEIFKVRMKTDMVTQEDSKFEPVLQDNLFKNKIKE